MVGNEQTYLKLMNIPSDRAVEEISRLASDLNGEEHQIRSSILELHLAIEFEVKRLLYHVLRGTILYSNDTERDKRAKSLDRAIDRLSIGTALTLLEAGVKLGPWPDLISIWELNTTRNSVSHRRDMQNIRYKGRNPFDDTDCLAQIYFDVWAARQCFAKLFERVVVEPLLNSWYYRDLAEIYRTKFGELSIEELPKLRQYPEW